MRFVKIRSCTLYKVAHWLLPNKTEDGGTFLRANGEPSAMRRRRWSSRGGWTPEWRARCRSHGPRGSWGWWKWITNKHKSGKLQASAPELPRLRKTIKPRQTLWRQRGREKAKKNWWGGGWTDRKSEGYWDRTAVFSLTAARLRLANLDLFTCTFSRDQSELSDGPPRWRNDDATSSLRRRVRDTRLPALTAIVRHTWRSGDPRTGIRRQPRTTVARNISPLLNPKGVQARTKLLFLWSLKRYCPQSQWLHVWKHRRHASETDLGIIAALVSRRRRPWRETRPDGVCSAASSEQ